MSLAWAINRAAGQGAVIGERASVGQRKTIQAPVSGWNTSDARAAMPPKFAVQLDNYFPEAGSVTLRRGSRKVAEGVGSDYVRTLIPHQSGTVSKLFAIGGGAFYEVTNVANADVIAATELKDGSYTSDRWRFKTFQGHTICVNGEDPPERIQPNGTLAAAHGWSKAAGQDAIAFDAAKLSHVLQFKGRPFFLEKDSPNLWYGGLGAVQGDLTRFALDRINAEGGNAVGIDTVTIDSGEGLDDILCIFFDNGSVLLYNGTDITSASDFNLVGRFNIGPLIADKGVVRYRGDLVAMTTDGYIKVASLLREGARSAHMSMGSNLSAKIANTVSEEYRLHGDQVGWECIQFTPANWLLFNLPIVGGVQHVMNTQTGAWCRFTGLDARCWAVWRDRIFYGGPSGGVFEANINADDDGAPIEGRVQGAFQYLGSTMDKRFTMARALVDSDADVSFVIGTVTDFNEEPGLGSPTALETAGGEWNVAEWNVAEWAGGVFALQEWQALNRDGTAISVVLVSSTRGARLRYYACDIIAENTIALL